MKYSLFTLTSILLPLALAQYGNDDSSKSSTTSAAAAAESSPASSSSNIHKVTVGDNNALAFSPNSFTAAVGDSIEFHFFPPTHTVVQSSFANPCAPVNASAFFSGAIMTTTGENKNVFTVLVNSTDPIWFYCGFPGHCQAGMVGVVNPPSSETIQDYASAAANTKLTPNPAHAQGGIIGPASTPSTSSGSGASQTSSTPAASPNSGVVSSGGIHWVLLAITGVVAIGIGSLMV